MTNELFPIKNNSACVYKWGWNTFRLYTGRSSSCHRIKSSFVSLDNFENFHNTPEVIQDRKLMLEGKWPGRGCEYCKDIESVGGVSDRIYHNNIPGLTPVDFNSTNLEVTPRVLEVYLDNHCDLACVYCEPHYSSRINAELSKFGPNIIGTKSIKKSSNHQAYFELLLKWLQNNSQKLQRLSIMGGEPLIQKEFWKLLEFLESSDNKHLEININSNLNSPLSTVQRYTDTMENLIRKKKIRRADISCSIDCWGPQQEFSRFGLKLNQWQENFEYLITKKWLVIGVHPVVNCLSISTMNEMQDRIIEYKKINPKIRIDYHLVDGINEETYHPKIFGSNFFKHELEHLLNNFPVIIGGDQESKARLEGIVKLISKGEVDKVRLKKLKLTLEQFDLRRKTNWRALFPKIDNFFEENDI